LPGVRAWALKRFPYIIFYADRGETIEILRVLHAHRDIGILLGGPAPDESSEL
jgi:toxin ParE1/3/4